MLFSLEAFIAASWVRFVRICFISSLCSCPELKVSTEQKPLSVEIEGEKKHVPLGWSIAGCQVKQNIVLDVRKVDSIFVPSTALQLHLREAPAVFSQLGDIRLAAAYKNGLVCFMPNPDTYVSVNDLPDEVFWNDEFGGWDAKVMRFF